jgi:hypothetical protein
MSDDAARMARLYPTMVSTTPTESAAPVVAGAQSEGEAQAAVVKSDAPAAESPSTSTELSDAEKELEKGFRMYPPEKALEHVTPVWPVDMPAEQQTELTAIVHTELGRKLMLGPQEAQTVVNAVSAFNQTDPTTEQQAAWRTESEAKLRSFAHQHGTNTAQLLADANAYLRRSPMATRMLADRKLLDHPQILAIAVERGRAARARGLLK